MLFVFGLLALVTTAEAWKYQRKFHIFMIWFVLTQATIACLAGLLYLDDSILDRIISVLMFLLFLGIAILNYPAKQKKLTEQSKQG
jgi:small-conductance mechanosensitive channel